MLVSNPSTFLRSQSPPGLFLLASTPLDSFLPRSRGIGDAVSFPKLCTVRLVRVFPLPAVMGAAASTDGSTHADGIPTKAMASVSNVTDEEWKKRLTKEQYMIARKKGTEGAFTGEYWNTKTPGIYACVCCGVPLFESDTKFDSGTGWPSFYETISNNVRSEMDWSIPFMPRTEVLCAKCDAHLGHVFNDGPAPTGKRYCINSASLRLKPRK